MKDKEQETRYKAQDAGILLHVSNKIFQILLIRDQSVQSVVNIAIKFSV